MANEEHPGGELDVEARDCQSGTGYTAFVEVELVDPLDNGRRIAKHSERAERDGVTNMEVDIPGRTAEGRYLAIVTCKHVFDGGGSGIFYLSDEPFRVEEGAHD